MALKLNLGSHSKVIDGYKNVDVLDVPNVDVRHDLTQFPWPFENDSVDEILMVEFLEHIPFKYTHNVLTECYRILKPMGKVLIQVPDIEKMIYYWTNRLICDCVPHKSKDGNFSAKTGCLACGGKARINPMRWFYAFVGAQKHPYDTHQNIFWKDKLRDELAWSGFKLISFSEDIYKIKMEAFK